MGAVDKYNQRDTDFNAILDRFDQRLRSLERVVSSPAMATSYFRPDPPWPPEQPNGDHVSAIGVIWLNSTDNTVWRWGASGDWQPMTPVGDMGPKSFWYLSAAFAVVGTGATVDINAWVEDGDTNSGLITMDSGQNVTLQRDGLYNVSTGITYPVNATGRRYLQVFTGTSGGSNIAGDFRGTSSTGVVSPQTSRTLRFAAGDIFRVLAAQDSGSTLNLLAGSQFCWLQVQYVGP